jgi:hypothetical protein
MSVTSTSSTIYPVITNAVKVEEKSTVEYTFTDIVIHGSNNDNTSNTSNNNNNISVKGILKKPEPYNEVNILLCVKSCMFITLLALTLPFIICNLYYAYNDESCVTINSDKFNINLKTYLAVDGIVVGIALLGIILAAFCFIKKEPNNDNGCLTIFGNFVTGFGIAWTIIGSIIFWGLIDNKKCDKSVYNYVFAQLVIKIICYSLRIISNSNNKK